MILESLGHALGGSDIDSTGELLSRVCDLNKTLLNGNCGNENVKNVQLGDVQINGSGH